jgi:hypothetical protein
MAPPCFPSDACFCFGCYYSLQGKFDSAQKNDIASTLPSILPIRWSLQEIRRIATRLIHRCFQPTLVIFWSLWRRSHQAISHFSHVKKKLQL